VGSKSPSSPPPSRKKKRKEKTKSNQTLKKGKKDRKFLGKKDFLVVAGVH